MTYTFQGVEISSKKLARLKKAEQIEVMKDWFYQRYQDPANTCPYDGREGGYQYVTGGPFDATEVLEDEFGEIVPPSRIEELVSDLERHGYEWVYTEAYQDDLGYFDDWLYGFDAALGSNEPLVGLKENLEKLKRLTEQKDFINRDLQKFQRMMIFSFCITSLESFLYEVFSKKVFDSHENKKIYLITETSFATKKFSLAEIFSKHEKIDEELKKEIGDTTFHNLARVKPLFRAFGVSFQDIAELSRYINKRHDFVHRGGQDREGNPVDTSVEEIMDLINKIEDFCNDINSKMEA